MAETMKDQIAGESPMEADKMPEPSSFDDYYKIEFSEGELTKKLIRKSMPVQKATNT